MSLSAAVIDALLATGATREQIAAAIKADIADREAAEAARLEAKREGNRERQRRFKERNNVDNALPASATVTERDAAPSLDKESPQTPKKLIPTPCVQSPRAKGDYHRLPEGWEPTRPLPPKTQAKVDQWPPGAIGDELAALHRWGANAKNEAGKGRKKDWDAAWVNWIERRHDERYGRTNGHGKPMGGHQSPDGLSTTTRAANRVFGAAPASVQH